MPPLAFSRCFGTCGPASLLRRAAVSLPRDRPSRCFLVALVRVRASTRLSGAAKGRRRSSQFVRASGKTLASTFCGLRPPRSAFVLDQILRLSPNVAQRIADASIYRRTARSVAGRHAATPVLFGCICKQSTHAARRRDPQKTTTAAMDHRPPIPPVPQPVAPPLQRPYEPPPLLGTPYDTFNGLTAAVAAQMPVQPPMAIQTALPPLGGVSQQPVPLKRPAPESQQKKKRVRRHWDECTNCDSKHGMRYGRVVNRQIQYLGCDRCKGDYFATHGVKLKDLTRVCECGSGKDRRYGPKGGTAVACVECKDQKVSSDGQPLINLRPSTGQCSCGSGKVKRFGYPPPADQGSRKGPSARTNCIDCKTEGMVNLSISASRRVEAPSLHSNASSPGMMEVGGLVFD